MTSELTFLQWGNTISTEDRRYSDKEFALILRRAFELRDRQPGGPSPGSADGLSLPEIQSIAKEVGLDATLIERAAGEIPAIADSAAARILGGPQKYRMEYLARGDLSREGLSRVVDTIRRSTSHQGRIEEAFGSVEWQTVGELSQIHVTVSPRGGETFVQIIADRGAAGAVLLIMPMVAGAIGIGLTGAIFEPTSVAGIAAVVAGPLAAAALTARTLWATTTTRFRNKLNGLFAMLSRTVDENVQAAIPDAKPREST